MSDCFVKTRIYQNRVLFDITQHGLIKTYEFKQFDLISIRDWIKLMFGENICIQETTHNPTQIWNNCAKHVTYFRDNINYSSIDMDLTKEFICEIVDELRKRRFENEKLLELSD